MSGSDYGDNTGEPGCLTEEELNKSYRNYWDPTSYWQCSKVLGEPAQRKSCPSTLLFSDKVGKCIPYTEWKWTEPTPPPSKPSSK